MDPRIRTAVTMTLLIGLLAGAGWWGWARLTEPIPEASQQGRVCEVRQVRAGEKVFRRDVVVSVFNAGTRSGLASRTLTTLTDRGFAPGRSGNAPQDTTVHVAQIWTREPNNPAVRLVARQFDDVVVKRGRRLGPGVVVVVGNQFRRLGKGVGFVRATRDARFCGRPTSSV